MELSSLFRAETDRRGNLANYTSNNNSSSNNENENGEDGDDEMNSNTRQEQQQRRRRKKKNNLVDKGSMNMNSTPNSVTSAAAKKMNINANDNTANDDDEFVNDDEKQTIGDASSNDQHQEQPPNYPRLGNLSFAFYNDEAKI